MPRFAANISLLYPEYRALDRIAAAARDGFAAIEVQLPYTVACRRVPPCALDDARTRLVLMNAPVGDLAGGDGAARRCRAMNGSSMRRSSARSTTRAPSVAPAFM